MKTIVCTPPQSPAATAPPEWEPPKKPLPPGEVSAELTLFGSFSFCFEIIINTVCDCLAYIVGFSLK